MEESNSNQEEQIIVRKAILTVASRRNPEYHPEFLKTENLFERFEPLMRSIHKRFCAYDGMFDRQEDIDDLWSQITYEFLRLRNSYDPKIGVDFPGYIKFCLQQRVYHYVTSQQRVVQHESVARQYGDDENNVNIDFDNIGELEDEDSIKSMEKVEAIASIDWSRITNPKHTAIIRGILIENRSIESIAEELNISTRAANILLEECCELLYNLSNEE